MKGKKEIFLRGNPFLRGGRKGIFPEEPGSAIHDDRTEDAVQSEAGASVVKRARRHRFMPPSVGEVAVYCEKRQNGIDPQSFIDHYSAVGWKVGCNRMSDWQAAVRTWENRRKKGSNRTTTRLWITKFRFSYDYRRNQNAEAYTRLGPARSHGEKLYDLSACSETRKEARQVFRGMLTRGSVTAATVTPLFRPVRSLHPVSRRITPFRCGRIKQGLRMEP